MPSQQQSVRVTRRGRVEDPVANPTVIPPPSSSGLDQENPTDSNLEGTDNPDEEELDGEALDEQLRDDIAGQMENYQQGEANESNVIAQRVDLTILENEEEDQPSESSSSNNSDGSTSDSSDEETSSSSSDSSSSSEDESNDSEVSEQKTKKGKRKSIKSLDKAIENAIKEREKANKKEMSTTKKRVKEGTNKHGKKPATKKMKSSSSAKSKVSKENGIHFQSGLACTSLLPTLQTY
ncbi:uncharacterized protein MELLADRAFT_76578 [Melampsora larici-populina 98AG31]|uniref:Uncharacterized protein n=1 Tax=Melampsora larici-populina (strain 98AG31 / pathotype 3-4-7) TaxID=747676 RepID=F4R5T6_MELLP|nr:uncharacterized protein MELLADRAFT_76578 [Melampsora larici-populina 98AG31]EGG12198.1 hypothetical protein MELLADRAFT_76578 [Melampsora larici-populina 98AG31]